MSREAPTVEAAIRYATNCEPCGLFVEYQPGDGTRYPMLILETTGPNCGLTLDDDALDLIGFEAGARTLLVVNLATCRSHMFRNGGEFLAASYVAEKLGCTMADGAVLAELIAYYSTRRAEPAGPERTDE